MATEETIRLTIEAKGAQEAVQILQSIGTTGEAASKQVSDGFVKLAASSEAGRARMEMMNAELKANKGAATSFTEALKYMNAEQTLAVQKIWQTTQAAQGLTTATNQATQAANTGANAQRNHANSVAATTNSYSSLSKALQIAIGYLSFREILKTVDAYNTLQTKLALVSGEQENTTRSVSKFVNVAQAAAVQSKGIFGNIIDTQTDADAAIQGVYKNIIKTTEAVTALGEKTKDVGNGFHEVTGAANKFGEVKIPSFSEAARGAKEYVVAADGVTEVQSRLISQEEQEEKAAQIAAAAVEKRKVAYEALRKTAILTGSDISVVGDSFVRLSNATQGAGYSQSQMLKVTDLVAKSLYNNKVSGQAAETALTQLGQAFSSGRLRGQDWNSVIQQAPGLIQVMANAITNGSIPALHKLALENGLTTDRMVQGFISQEVAINNLTAKTLPTLSGAFQSLKTGLFDYIGKTDEANGVSAKLAQGILFLGQNLDHVIPLVASFAAVWATIKAITVVGEMVAFFTTLPGIIVLAVGAIALLLDNLGLLEPLLHAIKVAWDDWAPKVVENFKAFGGAWTDFITIFQHDWNDVKNFFTGWFDWFGEKWTQAGQLVSDTWNGIKSAVSDAVSYIENLFGGWYSRLSDKVSSLLQKIYSIGAGLIPSANPDAAQPPAFRDGGGLTVPGAGPTDSRLVSFMATPGEVISVHTPAQAYGQAPIPKFRDGGALGLGGGGYGVNLGLSGVDVQYLASANTSVTGYNMGDTLSSASFGSTSLPNYNPDVGSNDNNPDLATQIANALSIASTSPLMYGRSVSSLGFMRNNPSDTNFIDSVIESTLRKGIDVSMFYAGLSAGDIRKGSALLSSVGTVTNRLR
jgi:tape measure domain-containing protein